MSPSFQQLVELYRLSPHAEGGYFSETYRSLELLSKASLPARFRGDRAMATAIYYLLPQGAKSRLHRIASDETWHFYLVGPLALLLLHPEGRAEKVILGQDVLKGQKLQFTVPAGAWFGAYPCSGSEYSFVGCTVAPGFDFADFELGNRSELLAQYPSAREVIELLS